MKRWVGMTAGVAALGLLAWLGNSLVVQGQGQPTTSGSTRVATVNLYVVMKGYKKAEIFKQELQKLDEPFVEALKKLASSYEDWVKYAKNPGLKQEDKDKAETVLKGLKRQMEDKKIEEEKVIMKRLEEQTVQIYKEIEQAVKGYASANGIHAVFHYMEPLGQEYTPMNIARKLDRCGSVGACYPMYTAPGVDISDEVVKVLNSSVGGPVTPTSH